MADIDLIPQDYRTRIWLQSRVKRTAVVMVTMVLVAGLAFASLNYLAGSVKKEIAVLQKQEAISTQQRDEITRLSDRKEELDNQLTLLGGLRSGVSASAMFRTIDNAMIQGEVWFQDWDFRRAGTVVENNIEPASNGYFIIMPASGEREEETWKIETHMTIRGQVRDHSALSRFVRHLFQQPEIEDIRILNTSLASNREVVNFNLAVTVNTNGASG